MGRVQLESPLAAIFVLAGVRGLPDLIAALTTATEHVVELDP